MMFDQLSLANFKEDLPNIIFLIVMSSIFVGGLQILVNKFREMPSSKYD